MSNNDNNTKYAVLGDADFVLRAEYKQSPYKCLFESDSTGNDFANELARVLEMREHKTRIEITGSNPACAPFTFIPYQTTLRALVSFIAAFRARISLAFLRPTLPSIATFSMLSSVSSGEGLVFGFIDRPLCFVHH